jgi:energy-coupling factor transporter ATP-binding protein EcfA2
MLYSANQKALNTLSTWIALEVLSPQEFREESYPTSNQILINLVEENKLLPWELEKDNLPKNKKYFYQIIIGTIDLEKSSKVLLQKYSDKNYEIKTSKRKSIIASISIDQDGFLSPEKISVAISSFAWAFNKALVGNLKDLSSWSKLENYLTQELDNFLRRKDAKGKEIPVSYSLIEEAYDYLIDVLQLPSEFTNRRFFAIKSEEKIDKKEPSNSLILNSFYLQDLVKAVNFFDEETANVKSLNSKKLKGFFQKLFERNNLNKGSESFSKKNLTQVPKNLKLYLGLENPSKKLNILKDHSVLKNSVSPKLIPSSCWPAKNHNSLVLLQQAAVNLSLSELKDGGILAVNGPPGTGKTTLLRDIVAGIVSKRAEEMCSFKNPESAFISTGKKIAVGNGVFELSKIDEKLKGFEILIASSNNKAVENISVELPALGAISDEGNDLRYFKTLSDKLIGAESWGMISAVLGNSDNCRNFSKIFWWDEECAFSHYLSKTNKREKVFKRRDLKTKKDVEYTPKIILENPPSKNRQEALDRWNEARDDFQNILNDLNQRLKQLEEAENFFRKIDFLESKLNELEKSGVSLLWRFVNFFRARIIKIKLSKKSILAKSEEYRQKIGSHIIDDKLFRKNRRELNITSPWCDEETKMMREKIFIKAIKVHKCFIDGAAKPLYHNLGIFFSQLSGNSSSEAVEFTADLWSSLFLVVPSVSTTFASAGKMLEKLPQESLGWLLIDEAGQASPQVAVGAISKTKRAVVVGDPMQIEPVVTLSESLTKSICNEFEVAHSSFNAPVASVQTLCETASQYFAELNGRKVGVPLLVHRRCEDPMFSISNIIAYDGLMVKEKKSAISLIKLSLGPSAWFDVASISDKKWSLDEGKKLIELLFKINAPNVIPDLFIITPFRDVVYELRNIVLRSGILFKWGVIDHDLWLKEKIGTVHTFQGKEAESVFFVLGASSKGQAGARIWAGKNPNLLNVSVTRAKEAFYVIGNKELWRESGFFKELSDAVI